MPGDVSLTPGLADRLRVLAERVRYRPDCVFCDPRKIAGTPRPWFTETVEPAEQMMVFEPLAPVVPGHLLVVPLVHVADATEDPHITAAVMEVAARVARQYDAANIITSIGEAATQTIRHLHAHVVPRSHGDGLPLPWTPQQEGNPPCRAPSTSER